MDAPEQSFEEASERLSADRFGPYRALRILGQGGMGVVYEAERADGAFQQRVAIKVIRATDDSASLDRLILERQILASLNHTAIARLLDGGFTDDGRPYLVMELIEGHAIDEYCDTHQLSLRERLELFHRVLQAVAHAHRNLILHRDLKPSNILITTDGRPKLLDFGIAKLLDPPLLGTTASQTRTEMPALTPEYASPEQLRAAPLTIASDVYSLGLVLYRLLIGQPAFDNVFARPPEAPRPSMRAPIAWRGSLRGDLDAIIGKALRPDPAQRYATVDAFAHDIDACLNGRVVLAHKGNRWYRVRKFAQQHKVQALAIALVMVGIVSGLGVALWRASIAGAERDRARAALVQAEQTLAQTKEVGDFLLELFSAPAGIPQGSALTADDVLRRAVQRAESLTAQPVLQARMFDVVGQMHYLLGLNQRAEHLLTRAVELRRAVSGPDHPDLAESMIHLARLYRTGVRHAEGERMVRDALRIQRASFDSGDVRIGRTLRELGWFARDRVHQEEMLRSSLMIFTRAGADVRERVSVMHSLASNRRHRGFIEEARLINREAVALAARVLGPDASLTGMAMIHLADQLPDDASGSAEAERLYRRGLAILEQHDGPYSTRLIHGLSSLAHLLDQRGEHRQAEVPLRRVYAIRVAAYGPEHSAVALSSSQLARNLARQGLALEAYKLIDDQFRIVERAVGRAHVWYADASGDLAAVHALLGNWDAAVTAIRATVEHQYWKQRPLTQRGTLYRVYGRYLMRAGRFAEAEAKLLRSLDAVQRSYTQEQHPNILATKRELFELYNAWGRHSDAARYRVPRVRALDEI